MAWVAGFEEQPWWPFLGAAALCLLVRLAILVYRQGLLVLLPKVAPLLDRTVFEIVVHVLKAARRVVFGIVRLTVLLCVELDEELLSRMKPELRFRLFQQPCIELCPRLVQRLLRGRAMDTDDGSQAPPAAGSSTPKEGKAQQPQEEKNAATEKKEGTPSSPRMGLPRPPARSRSRWNVDHILTEKLFGATVSAAWTIASSAQAQVAEAVERSQRKVSDVSDSVQDAILDPRTKASAVSAVGGAVALGAGGGATGLVSGTVLGAAVGVVPALFTFGLSIPVCSIIGGGVGMATGSALAGAAGLLGGGAYGWRSASPAEEGSS